LPGLGQQGPTQLPSQPSENFFFMRYSFQKYTCIVGCPLMKTGSVFGEQANITNLKTFVYWCRENRFLNGNLKLKELKLDEKPAKSLNDAQVKNLLKAAQPYPSMKIRILLALGTGLRRGDIQSLKVTDIDFEKNCIKTTRRMTMKSMGARPVPAVIIKVLKKYLNHSNSEPYKLFDDIYPLWAL
jgi:integrase